MPKRALELPSDIYRVAERRGDALCPTTFDGLRGLDQVPYSLMLDDSDANSSERQCVRAIKFYFWDWFTISRRTQFRKTAIPDFINAIRGDTAAVRMKSQARLPNWDASTASIMVSMYSPIAWPGVAIYDKWIWRLTETELLHEPKDITFLIMDIIDRERKHMERLRSKYSNTSPHPSSDYERPTIPDEVKMFVWRRDRGQCTKCGSQRNLEFDHIIPVSRGGSSTARNIQLLCEQCNRSKGANL